MKPGPDSFLIYWPKIRDLPIPQPATDIVELTEEEFKLSFEGTPVSLAERVEDCIKGHFNLPVFLRTDLSSGKHGWKNTCYYDGTKPLSHHLFRIFEFNQCASILGLSYIAVIIRQYIPMASGFTAFNGNMPVNPERRYFIKDREVLCHHPYWIPEAIKASYKKPDNENWLDIIERLNHEDDQEIELLTDYSSKVAAVIDGYWSVDFCKGANGKWYLIDMATGNNSWHPENCKFLER